MSTGRVTVRDDLTLPVVAFSRILVATDFSEGARAALDSALSIASAFGSKLFLVHVIPTQFLDYVSPESSVEAGAKAREYASRELAHLSSGISWGNIAHETILQEGPVWPVLRDIIHSNNIDLVAMGTYGRTSNQKFLLGSVAEEIFRMADFSTLTVGPHAIAPHAAAPQLHRILFATNFKPHAERASGLAHSLERLAHGHLAALHVVEDSSGVLGERHDMVRDFLIKRMRRGVPESCLQTCAPEFLVRFGEPADEILRAATEQHADLIVVGLRTAKKSAGLLPSPTAYKLVCQSPCPVLTHRQ